MAGEKARQLIRKAQDATTTIVHEMQETGELRHLYGQRLDLSDDSPDWFIHQLLKREGIAPPVVEQGKDLDAAQQAAAAILERVRRRRDWLCRLSARCTPEAARAFNEARERALEEYRAALVDLNRAIRDYNLVAPSPLHRWGIVVDHAMEAASREIPPLEPPVPAPPQSPAPSRLRAAWRRLHARR